MDLNLADQSVTRGRKSLFDRLAYFAVGGVDLIVIRVLEWTNINLGSSFTMLTVKILLLYFMDA